MTTVSLWTYSFIIHLTPERAATHTNFKAHINQVINIHPVVLLILARTPTSELMNSLIHEESGNFTTLGII
jgi:hypothetical protein